MLLRAPRRWALLTSFMVESGEALGLSWSPVLYGVTKFYDKIRLSALMGEADLQGYPLNALVMLVGSLAPRVLKEGSCCRGLLQQVDSILAECKEASSMARAALYRACEALTLQHLR